MAKSEVYPSLNLYDILRDYLRERCGAIIKQVTSLDYGNELIIKYWPVWLELPATPRVLHIHTRGLKVVMQQLRLIEDTSLRLTSRASLSIFQGTP